MATNPLIAQGTLNRLIGAVHVNGIPALNITAPYLGREGISLALEGDATQFINTMTGMVTSPEPYMPATVTVHLLKTQGLSLAWKTQLVVNALIGSITVFPDATPLLPFDFWNCGIRHVDPVRINGEDAGFVLSIYGTYYVNRQLWDQFTATAA